MRFVWTCKLVERSANAETGERSANRHIMRNGQKRMRGTRWQQSPQKPKSTDAGLRVERPDVKIRGTASHIAEKYIQLARDSQSSGDPVAAENYYQHAEHYFRLIAAAQEQFRQQNPYYNQQPQRAAGRPRPAERRRGFDGDDDDGQPFMGQNEPSYAPQPPAPAAALSAARCAAVSAARSAGAQPPATSAAAVSTAAKSGWPRRRTPESTACRHSSPAGPAAAESRPEPERSRPGRAGRPWPGSFRHIAGADAIAAAATVLIVRIISAVVNSKAQRPSRRTTKAAATSPGSRSKRRPAPARGQSAAG